MNENEYTEDVATAIYNLIKTYIQTKVNTSFLAEVTHVLDNKVNIKSIITTDENKIPIINNVPIAFTSAAGYTISMPVKKGDIGLAIVIQNDISLFKYKGTSGIANSQRTHHMNDSIFIPLLLYTDAPETPPKGIIISNKNKDSVIEITDDGINIKSNKIKLETPLGTLSDAFDSVIQMLDLISQGMVGSGTNSAAYQGAAPALKQRIKNILN